MGLSQIEMSLQKITKAELDTNEAGQGIRLAFAGVTQSGESATYTVMKVGDALRKTVASTASIQDEARRGKVLVREQIESMRELVSLEAMLGKAEPGSAAEESIQDLVAQYQQSINLRNAAIRGISDEIVRQDALNRVTAEQGRIDRENQMAREKADFDLQVTSAKEYAANLQSVNSKLMDMEKLKTAGKVEMTLEGGVPLQQEMDATKASLQGLLDKYGEIPEAVAKAAKLPKVLQEIGQAREKADFDQQVASAKEYAANI
jgi:hypothetical protein